MPTRPSNKAGSGRRALEERVDALQLLRRDPETPETAAALRSALADRNNFLVSKAAAIAGDYRLSSLTGDLTKAFHRFLEDAVKTDPQCWAKNGIAKALKDMEYEDAELYACGLRHIQLEPVWGGTEDTAITLRGTCAHGLVLCRSISDLEILRHLTDLLADAAVPARRDAVRAIAHLGRPEGALLIRLRVKCGDEPEVGGECFSALIGMEDKGAIEFVRSYLDGDNEDLRFEAAAALGESTTLEAFQILESHYQGARAPRLREALLLAIGATRRPEAIEYLAKLIDPSDMTTAAQAIAGLAPSLVREDVRTRVEGLVRQSGSTTLQGALRKASGG